MKNRLPSGAIILLPLADSEAPEKSELTLRGSRSRAEKLYHFLKLIRPVYYQSKEPRCETQWPAKKYICLPFAKDWQWKDSRTEYYSSKTFQGIKCCIKVGSISIWFLSLFFPNKWMRTQLKLDFAISDSISQRVNVQNWDEVIASFLLKFIVLHLSSVLTFSLSLSVLPT